jgi:lipoate synthase
MSRRPSTADAQALPKPPWLRVHVRETPEVSQTRALMRRLELGTVWEEAA